MLLAEEGLEVQFKDVLKAAKIRNQRKSHPPLILSVQNHSLGVSEHFRAILYNF